MRRLAIALTVVAVLVVAAGTGVWWFVLRDDAPEELGLSDQPAQSGQEGGTFDADGTWTVATASDVAPAAGLRITERFAGGAAENTAVGRTSEVDGSITIVGTEVTKGSFTVDLTSLTYTDSPPGLDVANRKRAMEGAGLETGRFPEATFTLTAPIDLGGTPRPGRPVTAEATGDLTLHGVTRPVTFGVEAQAVDSGGPRIEIATADPVPVKLADYDMTPPVIGPVASVADTGRFEFKLVLTKEPT